MFLGACNYYAKFAANYANIALPLYDLLARPTLEFDPTCDKSISDAVNTLDKFNNLDEVEEYNKVTWILLFSFMGL